MLSALHKGCSYPLPSNWRQLRGAFLYAGCGNPTQKTYTSTTSLALIKIMKERCWCDQHTTSSPYASYPSHPFLGNNYMLRHIATLVKKCHSYFINVFTARNACNKYIFSKCLYYSHNNFCITDMTNNNLKDHSQVLAFQPSSQ